MSMAFTSVILLSKTYYLSLNMRKTSDEFKLRDSLQKTSTSEHCQGHWKQGKSEKLS